MYRVLVVDDEPSALDYICTIIQKKCPGFQNVETAANGLEGLKKMEEGHPDLVIADMKMPVMSGLEMVQQAKKRYPDMLFIIVSGYQDFEYLKGAMKEGVCDYVLKPVAPKELQNAMDQMRIKIEKNDYDKKLKLIRRMQKGEQPDENEIRRYFDEDNYYSGVVRKNGLPKRFAMTEGWENFSYEGNGIFMYGRDEMEMLCFMNSNDYDIESFEKRLLHMMGEKAAGEYVTAILSREPCGPREFPNKMKQLYHALYSRLIIGYDQKLILEQLQWEKTPGGNTCVEERLQNIFHWAKEKDLIHLKEEINQSLIEWERQKKTQIWVEQMVHRMIYGLKKFWHLEEREESLEFILEDIFFYAASMDDIRDGVEAILTQKLSSQDSTGYKVDTPEFFERIKNYVQGHLTEPLTLQSVCEEFGISQTSLSKIFRKYAGDSFINYLTAARIQKAKDLMGRPQRLYIKDIAVLTGFKDPFYFSRIFRSVTGVSPTDYMERRESKGYEA